MLKKLLTKLNNTDFIWVTLSTVLCSGLSFVFSVYAKRYINTTNYGIYSTCLLAQTYMTYAQLGVLSSYNRDYPQALGRGDMADAQKMKNHAVTFILGMYLTLFVVFDAIMLIIYRGNVAGNYYAFGYLVCPVLLIFKLLDDWSVSTARIQGEYNKSAKIGLTRTIISMALGVIAIRVIGYYGLYVMPFASAILGILFYRKISLKGVKLEMDFSYIKGMVWGGLPLLIESLIWTVVSSVDKFVILGFMTTDDLGVYSVPLMGFTTMVLIPQTISGVFYNKVSILYGETGDVNKLLDKAKSFTGITAALTGGACVTVFYILPIFVSFFMPLYTDGTTAAQILIIGVAIYSTTMLYGNLFSVLKLNKELITNSIWLLVFNAVFSSGLVLFVERSINMVAIGTGISYALYSMLLIFKLRSKFGYSLIKLVSSSWLPLLAIVVPCVLFYIFMPSIWIALVLSILDVLAVYAIILLYVKKRR